jgi:hypothetical protein
MMMTTTTKPTESVDLDRLTRYDHRGALMVPDQTGDYFLVPDVRAAVAQARASQPAPAQQTETPQQRPIAIVPFAQTIGRADGSVETHYFEGAKPERKVGADERALFEAHAKRKSLSIDCATVKGRRIYSNERTQAAANAWDARAALAQQSAGQPSNGEKAASWFNTLAECARLLGLPDDEPIPSGVLRAVQALTQPAGQPAPGAGQEPVADDRWQLVPKYSTLAMDDVLRDAGVRWPTRLWPAVLKVAPAAPVSAPSDERAAVADGFVLAPRKLTDEMRAAARHKLGFTQMYEAAIAAAPAAQEVEPDRPLGQRCDYDWDWNGQ